MGVQGLWELLTPVGRRVSVDALGSRKLAIDASIWIIQFMKAMRDDKGDMIRNAHLLGFFRRICKLLYLRIKPVFVFDGATPALKRRTVLARRRQREKAQSKIRKTAEKLLLNHLRTRKLEEIASEISLGPQSRKAKSNDDVDYTPVVVPTSEQQSRSDAQVDFLGHSSSNDKYDQEATDALLAASLARDYEENPENSRGSAGGSVEGSDDDAQEELVLPAVKGLDPSVLASLPPSMQLDLLVQMREQLVAENRQKFQKVAKVPTSFSEMQIQAYLKTVAFRREINEVQKAAAGGGIGGVPTARVTSTTDREFIFSKSFEGEKPAPSEIEEQRRSEQATPVKATPTNLPTSLMKPSSVLFSSMTSVAEKSAPDEDGVVSLVSTQLNEETDSNSNSVVHTYIDERGHVRVNRRRGMGVRMTRDLQWNLYLMKDVEARKSGESTSVAVDPPIIPSISIRNTAFPTSNVVESGPMMEKGLQISFVDDGGSELSKDEDGDLFEELVMEGGESKGDQASAIHGPNFVMNNADLVQIDAGVINGENVEDEVEWEDGGIDGSRDGSVVEDKDLAEAVRLSLLEQHPAVVHMDEPNNQILLEDGPSSGESEVEWEDGTGDVSVGDWDGATNEEEDTTILVPSEEAEFQEAIRRSLEDFCPPAKPSSQLVIKEPVDSNTKPADSHINNPSHESKWHAKHVPLVRAEAESEEVYLARERTRKGKAVLGGDEEGSLSTVRSRPPPPISEQEQIAALTLSEMPVIEATMQVPVRLTDNPKDTLEREAQGKIDSSSMSIPIAAENHIGNEQFGVPSTLPIAQSFVEGLESSVKVHETHADSSKFDVPKVNALSVQPGEHLGVKDSESPARIPASGKLQKATELEGPPHEPIKRHEDDQTGLPHGVDRQMANNLCLPPSQTGSQVEYSQDDLLREAEEVNIAMEREELQSREAALTAEMEQLAREEANLQAELEVEQEDIQAGFDREREMLAQEEMELRATQKKNERNADSVTGEMFTEVQELLQMFGLPYLIAPMEAEAQCAYMDTIQLVDGVVTDDSDVFLFGGRTVYKNLFDDRKYVETYYMKDLETEMGMSREKLIRIAMLLGSDYTEGISGIGIVNAIEVVNAFPEDDGLQKFKEWLDAPDHALFQKAQGHPKKGKGKGSGKGDKTGVDESLDGDGAGDIEESEDAAKFTPMQQVFMGKHRAVSKNWNIPESFPSEAVVSAYISPAVDKSKETFTWGRPDLEALRRFCYERFVWNKDKADELLLPVLKEYDRRETQTRLESFYHFNQRFAKIRSSRIQKAVTGMTGKRSAELMELPPHLITQSSPRNSQKKVKLAKQGDSGFVNYEALDGNINLSSRQHDPDAADDTRHKGGGLGGRGRPPRRGGKQHSKNPESVEQLAESVDHKDVNEDVNKDVNGGVSVRGGRGRSGGRGRGRGRGRGKGKGRAAEKEEEASISDSSDSDDAMGETLGEINSLKRKADENQQPRRSTRQRSQVATYQVDNSDEEAGGTCSDGEEMFKEVDLLVAEVLRNKPKGVAPGVASFDIDKATNAGSEAKEGTEWAETSVGQTKVTEPTEMIGFKNGGGFCPCEEDDLGQQGQQNIEPAYFASGGGFCLPEDESDLPVETENAVNVEEMAQGQQSDGFGGGFCLSDEDAVALPAKEGDFIQGRIDNPYNELEDPHFDQRKQLEQSPLMPDSQGIPGVSQGGEAVELGLRAMPLMRRKTRKSS